MSHDRSSRQQYAHSLGGAGFTMVELMLAMSFVSALLVAIVMTTMQVSHIYNRGLTLREVNQAGRAVLEDMQNTVAVAAPFSVDTASATTRYVDRPGGGRLCTGKYTYAWNYGKSIAGEPSAPAVYNKYTDGSVVRYAKVNDTGAALCMNASLHITKANAVEMLSAGDRDLAVHKMSVASVANDTETVQALYAISMTIGTNDQSQLLTANDSCKPPSANIGNEDYCSVNQFDIVVRAGNKSGGDQ